METTKLSNCKSKILSDVSSGYKRVRLCKFDSATIDAAITALISKGEIIRKTIGNTEILIYPLMRNGERIYQRDGNYINLMKLCRCTPGSKFDRKRLMEKISQQKTSVRLIDMLTAKHIPANIGSVICLPGSDGTSHYGIHEHILRSDSCFATYDMDKKTYNSLFRQMNRIRSMFRDERVISPSSRNVWTMFDRFHKEPGKQPMFAFFHLSTCTSVKMLEEEFDWSKNIERLSKWNNIKSPFYLETTYFAKPTKITDHFADALKMIDKTIPNIWKKNGWIVKPTGRYPTHGKFAIRYQDGKTVYLNGFHKFARRR